MRRSTVDLVVVTGASGGIGRWIAAAASDVSGVTILVGRDERRLRSAAAECTGDVRIVMADVASGTQTETIARIVQEIAPRRVAVVAGAGVVGPIAVPGLEEESAWESAVATNLFGTYRVVHPLLGLMRARDWGRIIAVSSAQTLHGPDPVMTGYATSKLAVNAYIACLASHFQGTGVSACAIHPGDIFTNMGEDIRRKAEASGQAARHLSEWARGVSADGGDDPREAGGLVAEILRQPAAWSNGRFLLTPSSAARHPRSHWAMDVGPGRVATSGPLAD